MMDVKDIIKDELRANHMKFDHNEAFLAHLKDAFYHFFKLPFGQFLWYTFLFGITDGFILVFLPLYWMFVEWKNVRKEGKNP